MKSISGILYLTNLIKKENRGILAIENINFPNTLFAL